MLPTAEQATGITALIVGIGLALSVFVFAGVTILRGMIGSWRYRRIALPVAGIGLGWVFTGLVVTILDVTWTGPVVALVLMVGFDAYTRAAGIAAHGKDARK